MVSILSISPYTSIVGFVVGLPTLAATYYQSWTSRRENERVRQGLIFSSNCLEFVLDDGTTINLVPLETLHSLPQPGDIVLLPGWSESGVNDVGHGAYSVRRIEHIYTRVEDRKAHKGQARLIKTVAHVDTVSGAMVA
jgi:hypothetical protein